MNFYKLFLFLFICIIQSTTSCTEISILPKNPTDNSEVLTKIEAPTHQKTLAITKVPAKIMIITPTSNHPEFIVLQDRCFKQFLKDDYEFIVFNDAQDTNTVREIHNTCITLNIPCIRVPQENRPVGKHYSWASYRHGQAMNYALQSIALHHDGIVVIIDSDMFLIKEFSITNFLKEHDIAGLGRKYVSNTYAYLWPGLLFLRMNALPDKNTISLLVEDTLGFDTGGALYHYLKAHPYVPVLPFKQGRIRLGEGQHPYYVHGENRKDERLYCASCQQTRPKPVRCLHTKKLFEELLFRNIIIDLILSGKISSQSEFLLGDTFFHLGRISGYLPTSASFKAEREKLLQEFIARMLNQK